MPKKTLCGSPSILNFFQKKNLGGTRGALGAVLGPVLAPLGRPWALLCPFWGAVWPLLGRSWAPLGHLPEKCLQQTIKTNFVGTNLHCFTRCGLHFRTKSVTLVYVYILFLLASTDNLLRRVGGQGGALQISPQFHPEKNCTFWHHIGRKSILLGVVCSKLFGAFL